MILKCALCIVCWLCTVQCSLSNISSVHPEYLTMKEGDPCIKGKMYKISCNTCHCADNNALYCTKMACLQHEDIQRFSLIKKRSPQRDLRSETKEKKDKIYLPDLPEGRCVPGKLYNKKCQKCYCDYAGKPMCNPVKPTKCVEPPKIMEISSPIDMIPPISNKEFWELPILPHSAAKCQSGKMYLTDCNTCLCLDNGNLLCETLLCLNKDQENAIKAKKWSGVKCKDADNILSDRCIRCDCTNNITQCKSVMGCAMPAMMKLHGNTKMRLNLDVKKEKCKPGAVYKTDCNHCYCQPDLTLRCTQKSCLNYRQALKLKNLRSYLQRHGL